MSFIIWTDHKNLEYIRSIKHLKSRQARWALVFSRFDFSISYCLGSKNIKPDALKLFVSMVTWEIGSKVSSTLHLHPIAHLVIYLCLRVYGPTLSSGVIAPRWHVTWVLGTPCFFLSKGSGGDLWDLSNRPPAGLLQPLLVTSRPLSHISLNLVRPFSPLRATRWF